MREPCIGPEPRRLIGKTLVLSLIVATKDRPQDLCRLLESLSEQTVRPDEIVVVDASNEPVRYVVERFPELNVNYLRYWPPSAAAQRNAGIAARCSEANLVGILDDDTTFEVDALEKMLSFWETAPPNIVGASFNLLNHALPRHRTFKTSWLTDALGLYPKHPGGVAPSGWQGIFGTVTHQIDTEWLPTTAAIWRATVFSNSKFDDFFKDYSYLEDLDFSYSLSRQHRLCVIPEARYYHHASRTGRHSARASARAEVTNRLYFVRKHNLSVWRCWLAMVIRIGMTLLGGMISLDRVRLTRARFNLEEVVRLVLNGRSR